MKKQHKNLAIFLVSFLVLVILGLLLYVKINIAGYASYPIDYVHGEYMGINLDEDAIHFGTISENMVFEREIEIISDEDVIVNAYLFGIENIDISDNGFYLPAGEKKTLVLSLKIPENYEMGYYTGKLSLVYLRV